MQFRARRPFVQHRAHHFGYNVARALHNNGVAHAHVARADFITIMQGCALPSPRPATGASMAAVSALCGPPEFL